MSQHDDIIEHMDHAETKAWEALARYKFSMFGYWAAVWVHLNRISGKRKPSPFSGLVKAARQHINNLTP